MNTHNLRSRCRIMLPLLAAVAIVAAMPSCKTTEKNYREAYERTKSKKDSTARDFDQTVYGKYRREMRNTPIAVEGDTLDARVQRVKITADGGGINENMRAYLIVAGEFKQLFNARSMRQRLVDNGYPGAFVVETGEPYYYVIATTADTPAQAIEAIEKLRKNPPFKLREGVPFALRPPQFVK